MNNRLSRKTKLFYGVAGIGDSALYSLMGTFALQQVATAYAKGQQEMPPVDTKSLRGFGLTLKDFTSNLKTIIVSLVIGLFIGFLPGMGSGISNLIAYGQAKKMDKHPEKFGTGYDPGVWATEVANNAGVGGALIPMISLGIPGDATTVLLLSAMTIKGLTAGPMFIQTNPVLAALIFMIVMISALLIFVTELFTKKWFPPSAVQSLWRWLFVRHAPPSSSASDPSASRPT
jgi:putative tricarboxylic transport membrane protein